MPRQGQGRRHKHVKTEHHAYSISSKKHATLCELAIEIGDTTVVK
jgi:hypothetical protein